MIALKITDIKKLMHSLLYTTSFDSFSMQEISIIKDFSIFLEGRQNKDFYTIDDLSEKPGLSEREFVTWSEVRPFIASSLKGDHTPISFKFVLQAPASYLHKLLSNPAFTADPSDVKALILTFRFEHGELTCLTGTAFNSFILDKSLDPLWDSAIRKSLAGLEIAFDEL